MNKIEALALAIAAQHDSLNPNSDAFQHLNPGLLRVHPREVKAPEQAAETRQFSTMQGGYRALREDLYRKFSTFDGGHQALMENLEAKCSGRPPMNGGKGLTQSSTLQELCRTFRGVNCRTIAQFLRDALNDNAINEHTPLIFFVENN